MPGQRLLKKNLPNLQKMIRSRFIAILLPLLTVALLVSCNRVPGYVIPPDDMAEVMADMHTAEAVVEMNYGEFPTDSAKMLLKQSVLARHGYTLQDLDTSFMWYGHNLKLYGEIFDNEVEILQDRLTKAGMVATNRGESKVVGDSVNIWDKSRFFMIKPNLPGQIITFDLPAGSDWEKGDIFTLRAKFANTSGTPALTMTADYTDGSMEFLTNRFSFDGWHSVSFYADSTKTPSKIYGAITFKANDAPVIVDSIELIRKPIMPELYGQRYRQRTVDLTKPRESNIPASSKPVESDEESGSQTQPARSESELTETPSGKNDKSLLLKPERIRNVDKENTK